LLKYQDVKIKRSEAGKLSAAKRASTKSTSVESVKSKSTNPTVKDTVTVTVKDTVTVKEIKEVYRSFAHLSISIEENKKLLTSGYRQSEIDGIYNNIENFKKNTNYNSLYLTSINWLKRDFPERIKSKIKEDKLYTYWMQDRGTLKDRTEKQYQNDKKNHESNGWEIKLISSR